MDSTIYKRFIFVFFPTPNTFIRNILVLILYYLHSFLISHIFKVLLWYLSPHSLKPQIKKTPKALLKHMWTKVEINLHLS